MRTLGARVVHYHTCFNGGFEIPFGLRRERWIGEGCKAVGLISNFGIAITKASTMYASVNVDVIYRFRVQASLGTCTVQVLHTRTTTRIRRHANQENKKQGPKPQRRVHLFMLER